MILDTNAADICKFDVLHDAEHRKHAIAIFQWTKNIEN